MHIENISKEFTVIHQNISEIESFQINLEEEEEIQASPELNLFFKCLLDFKNEISAYGNEFVKADWVYEKLNALIKEKK